MQMGATLLLLIVVIAIVVKSAGNGVSCIHTALACNVSCEAYFRRHSVQRELANFNVVAWSYVVNICKNISSQQLLRLHPRCGPLGHKTS